jgi:hypothetical protein
MSIQLVGTGGLFTRLGKIGLTLKDTNAYQSTTLANDVNGVAGQYTGSDLSIIGDIETTLNGSQQAAGSILNQLQTIAGNTLNQMVYNDNPLLSKSDTTASLNELIRQMKLNAQSVQSSTVSATITANGSNLGTGVVVASLTGTDGLTLENVIPENITVKCIQDSSGSPSNAGNETFSATGQVAAPTALDWRWPIGSAGTTTLTCLNPNASGAIVQNGDFENFTSNTPNNWSILVGTAGTTVLKATSGYTGAGALQYVGNGTEQTSIAQAITVQPDTGYHWNLWQKVDVVPAAGVLEVSLVDGSNAVILDNNGNSNAVTLNLHTGSTTSYASFGGSFRTPHVLPATVKLRVRLSTAMSSGSNLFIDRLAMGQATQLYQCGPYLSIFSGAANFYAGDYFTVGITNNHGGASDLRNFQTLMFRLFPQMQANKLLLPSSGSPTISNSLIA